MTGPPRPFLHRDKLQPLSIHRQVKLALVGALPLGMCPEEEGEQLRIALVAARRSQLQGFIQLYNEERPHQALQYQTPAEVYYGQMLWPAPGASRQSASLTQIRTDVHS